MNVIDRASVVLFVVIVVLTSYLVVSSVRRADIGLECAYGGALYYNTEEKRIVEFSCE